MSTTPPVSSVSSRTTSSKAGAPRRARVSPRGRLGLGGLGVALLSAFTLVAFAGENAFAATNINLGAATSYAVIAGSTITNTGPTVITGDVGLSPGTSITGFPPGIVAGTIGAADAASLAAQTSSTAAYGIAAGETPFTTVAGGTLGGNTLTPGVYESASSLSVGGTLTLNGGGDPNSVFIFQAGSTLITASSTSIVLEGGAQACHVYWAVGSSATLGTTTSFVGTILAQISITLNSGTNIDGRALAQSGAVTLDDNTITAPTCSTPTTPTTTTTTPAGTTTTTPAGTTPGGSTTTTSAPAKTGTKSGTKPGAKTGSATTTTGGSTVIPVGAPQTGDGGTAGSGLSPWGLLGLGALAVSAGAGATALRARRRHE
jgi:Ice-binding-like